MRLHSWNAIAIARAARDAALVCQVLLLAGLVYAGDALLGKRW
jgi:hypothetical protein